MFLNVGSDVRLEESTEIAVMQWCESNLNKWEEYMSTRIHFIKALKTAIASQIRLMSVERKNQTKNKGRKVETPIFQ